jgi:hypothetical protein
VTVIEYSAALARDWRVKLRLMPLLLTLLAFPFVAAGWTAGRVVVGFKVATAAVRTGYADVRARYPNAV